MEATVLPATTAATPTALATPTPPSLPLLEVTPLLDVTSPTLLESSMSPRGRLRLMLRLTPTTPTDTTDSATLDTTVLDTPDSLATWDLSMVRSLLGRLCQLLR